VGPRRVRPRRPRRRRGGHVRGGVARGGAPPDEAIAEPEGPGADPQAKHATGRSPATTRYFRCSPTGTIA
jgi:hypothetical protein